MLELRLEDSSPCQVLLRGSHTAQEDAAQGAETRPGKRGPGPMPEVPTHSPPLPLLGMSWPGPLPHPAEA